jgi:NTP pyrophosphatase (non-canonical NTP hydrolase)
VSHNKEIEALMAEVRAFAVSRDWEQFHTPKNLAMAIAGEAGELVAEFQWLKDEESVRGALSAAKFRDIELEVADVAIYLLRLSDVLGINLPEVIRKKLEINHTRF